MKFSCIKINKFLTLAFLLIAMQHVRSQSASSSPYSRFAFGEIAMNSHSSFYGLGNISLSLCDSFQYNSHNPASYSFLLRHKPIFDFGIGGQHLNMATTESNASAVTFGLRNISLGIPISPRWGISFGITPVSSMGYSLVHREEHPVIGEIMYKYDGSGGISRLYTGASFMPVKRNQHRLSVGANLAYLFGSLQSSSRAIYVGQNSQTGTFHSKRMTNTFVSDFIAEGGFLYRGPINTNTFISVGANFNASSRLYAKREKLVHTFDNQVTESIVDTVEYQESGVGRIYYPKKFGFGFSIDKRFKHKTNQSASRRLVLSVQYDLQDWAQYSEVFDSDTVTDGMRNSRSYSFGISFNPFSSNIIGPDQKWWQISTYRIAFSRSFSYLQLDTTQLNHYGISFGIGIPMLNSMSFSNLNIGIEAGKRGTLENGLIEESYIKLNLGLTIAPSRSDLWFIKRKYD